MIVLISDGQPTDDWQGALKRFNASPFGRKPSRTVRAAIGIGSDGDTEVLSSFTGNPETVLQADTSIQLLTFLKWATVKLSEHSSQGRSTTQQEASATDAEPVAVDLPRLPDAPPAGPDDFIL